MIEADPPESPVRDRSARVTLSRTWELELFISGATVFALLQAPSFVDQWWARTDPHLAGNANALAFLGYYYAKLILYTLISTFVLHLLTRAYWVALVGLHSVYPEGARWEQLRYGPAFRSVYASRLPTLEAAIRRVDDISSLLFAGGAVVMLMFLSSTVLVAVLAIAAMGLSRVFFAGEYALRIGGALLILVSMVPMVAKLIDTRQARRSAADDPPGPVMRRLAAASYHLSFTSVLGPLTLVMASNIGRRRAGWALGLAFVGIIGTFLVRDSPLGHLLRTDNHMYMPDAMPAQDMAPLYYADRRVGARVLANTPAIQSEIISDPYVRLFLPMTPHAHNAVIAERCPEVPTFREGVRLVSPRSPAEPADMSLLLACLARLQPVSLNGVPIDSAPFRLTTDETSGVRGAVLFIPVAGLEAGEHVLRVERLPRPTSRTRLRADTPRPPHIIRFWL